MRRGGSLLITILLLLAAFWAGIQYERNNCRIDLPEHHRAGRPVGQVP